MKLQAKSIDVIAGRIKELLEHHPEKGMIHATYDIARQLQDKLNDPRLMFHGKANKMSVYQAFRKSPEHEGKVLVGSGLTEGIDLAEDMGRWQVVTKVPFPSLEDAAVAQKAKEDGGWYVWQAVRDMLQAYGRICRGPTDYGVTYCFDTQFARVYEKHRDMWPDWFRNAVHTI
jgi:ATP-dependent DNA helicase DinG